MCPNPRLDGIIVAPTEAVEPQIVADKDSGHDLILNAWGGPVATKSGLQIEIQNGSLFDAVIAYACAHHEPFSMRASKSGAAEDTADAASSVELGLGYGETKIGWEEDEFTLSHQAFGRPHWAGGRYPTLVLSSSVGGEAVRQSMGRFLRTALSEHESSAKGHITLYSFVSRNGYWHKDRSIRKRPSSTVILPAPTTSKVLDDVSSFLSAEAREWYAQHGVPYKRTFLLWGPPGCGKSSLVTAVASEFDCNVCVISLADPDLKDDGLRQAMQRCPKRSCVVFEDVDAVFDHHREKRQCGSLVTFSGLLNALDGVGDPKGTVFFLTTNFKERLDKALIRPGRVDVQVKIEHASDDQMGRMLSRFYPAATTAHRASFVRAVRGSEGGRRVSCAQLQEHFVQHRTSGLEEAIAHIRLGAAEEEGDGGMWS